MELKRKRKSKYYSRKGCVSCKRAHIKCDEMRPACSRCVKRETMCEYMVEFQNSSFVEIQNSSRKQKIQYKIVNESDLPHKRINHSSIENDKPNTKLKKTIEIDEEVCKIHASNIPNNNILQPVLSASHSFSEASDNGRRFSFSNLCIDDLVSVEQHEPMVNNSPNKEYEKMVYLYREEYHPNLHSFEIPWDGGPLVYFIDIIERNDPLSFDNNININDQKMIDFVWTMTRISKFFYIFVLYSESSLISILDLCFKLGTRSSIFQSIMTYHCSLHIIKVYTEANDTKIADLWDRKVRIPAFRQCIDFLRDGLEKNPSFCDSVVLAFAVLIIFSGNASDQSWSTHLSGSYQLITKCMKLKKTANREDSFDVTALKLLDLIIEWYEHTNYSAAITSLDGYKNKNLKSNASSVGNEQNFGIAENGINLMSGHCVQLDEVMSSIYYFFLMMEQNKIKLSGLNIVFFVMNKDQKNEDALDMMKIFGTDVLESLNKLIVDYRYIRLGLEDIRMDLSIKYCNLIYMHGLKVFLIYFFIGERDRLKIRSLLRDIIDFMYSMPYRSSCAKICHWCIYISALISLLIQDYELYGHFLGILKVFQLNGMDIPSFNMLERVKLILLEGNYWKLVQPENDIVIC